MTPGTLIQRLTDTSVWIGFLAWILVFSVITPRFDSELWQIVSAFFYGYLSFVCVLAVFGLLRVNLVGIRRATPLLVVLVLSVVWLFLQILIPADYYQLFPWLGKGEPPVWFEPRGTVSLVPAKTVWLALSSFLVLCWFALAVALINSRARVKQLLWLLGGIALLHAIIGIVAVQKNIILVEAGEVDGHFMVARGLFVNRNHYAAFLLSTVCGLLGVFLHGAMKSGLINFWLDHKLTGLLLTVSLIVILLAIIYSQSRAGLIAPAAAVVLTLLIARCALVKLPYLRLMQIGTFFLLALAILLFWQGGDYLHRLQDLSAGERLLQWEVTWQAIQNSPWFGYGGGSYATVFQATRNFEEFRQVVYNQAHNQYLHMWLEQGLVGLLLWFALVFMVIRTAFRTLKTTKSRLERAATLAGLVAISSASVQALVDFNLQIVSLKLYFFLWIALVILVGAIHTPERRIRHSLTR